METQAPAPEPKPSAYDALSVKERAWVDAYLACGMNQTAASRSMGYKAPEMHGLRMSKNVGVPEAIAERIKAGAMQADEVLYRLAQHARGSLADVLDPEEPATIAAVLESPRVHLVKSVAETRHGIRVEMYDAQAALEKIGKALGLFGAKGTRDDPHVHEVRQSIVIGGTEVVF